MEVALLACALLALSWLSWFAFGMVNSESQRITVSQEALAQLDSEQKQISDATAQYNDAKDALAAAQGLLMKDTYENKLTFIQLVEQFSQKTEVAHIINTVVESTVGTSNTSAVSAPGVVFNINVSGDFPNLMRFIYLLENGPYYLTLDRVQMTGGGPPSSTTTQDSEVPAPIDPVAMQLSVKVFTQ